MLVQAQASCIEVDVVIHIDNALVVHGSGLCWEWAASVARRAGELWKELYGLLFTLADCVKIKKVKGHATQQDVDEGIIEGWRRAGNAAADKAAKNGRNMALQAAPLRQEQQAFNRAISWYRWARRHAAEWVDDAEVRHSEGAFGKPALVEKSAVFRLHDRWPHRVWYRRNEILCKSCGRACKTERPFAAARFLRTRCLGAAAARLASISHALSASMKVRLKTVNAKREEDLALRGYVSMFDAIRSGRILADFGAVRLDFSTSHLAALRGGGDAAGQGPWAVADDGKAKPTVRLRRKTKPPAPLKAHDVDVLGDTVFCRCCGAYSTQRLRGIAGRCPGVPPLPGTALHNRLQRLKGGRHPLTQLPLLPAQGDG